MNANPKKRMTLLAENHDGILGGLTDGVILQAVLDDRFFFCQASPFREGEPCSLICQGLFSLSRPYLDFFLSESIWGSLDDYPSVANNLQQCPLWTAAALTICYLLAAIICSGRGWGGRVTRSFERSRQSPVTKPMTI